MSDSTWNVVIGFIGLVATVIGLGFVAVQVALTRRQATEARVAQERDLLLRRKEATMAHIIATADQVVRYQVNLPDDFDAAGVADLMARAIDNEAPVREALTGYFHHWESLALGTSLGVYDLETVCRMSGARITALVTNYRPYLLHRRASTGMASLFTEIEWLADQVEAWRRRLPTEQRRALRVHQPPGRVTAG